MHRNLLLALSSILLLILVLAGCEFLVRAFYPEINFQGIDRHLLKDNVFGKTWGWQPDATGICFGNRAAINHEGFRKLGEKTDKDSVLLFIGDSVLFGVGVEAESTFAGLFQKAMPERNVLNTGVVGYSVQEYTDIVEHILPRVPVSCAVIFYSLNDFYDGKQRTVQSWNGLSLLRENSKLYLLLKNLLFDRSQTYFEYDAGFYTRKNSEVETAITGLIALTKKIEATGTPCRVVLLPYEYQLRNQNATREPQRMVSAALREEGLEVMDSFSEFISLNKDSRSFFLYGDHMHLSAMGNRVVYERIARELR